MTSARILVVDDFPDWRRFVCSSLEEQPGIRIVGVVSNGLEAVQKAREMQPDLIVLDIGLPGINGIEAARRIRNDVPQTKILFFSETRAWDVAKEALRIGMGYAIKAEARAELLPAVEAVLQGRRFLSSTFSGQNLEVAENREAMKLVSPPPPQSSLVRHEVQFYTDDAGLADGFARFVQSGLRVGNLLIIIATEAHRRDICSGLRAAAVDVDSAIAYGSFIVLDSADALSGFMDNGLPDPVRLSAWVRDLLGRTQKHKQTGRARIAICGECAPTLLSAGNTEGAIRLEHLWDEITRKHGADTLCGYVWNASSQTDSSIFQRICAEHSAVHGRELAN